MKYLKTYENKGISAMQMFELIQRQEYQEVEDILKNGEIDINVTVGSSIVVPLITSVSDIGMLELLTKYNVDWYQKDNNGKDFIDRLEQSNTEHQKKLLKYIKWKYPERYQEHLTRKEATKYNI